MLKTLFTNTVRNILGVQPIVSKEYNNTLIHDRSDKVIRQTRLEATPHFLDKAKYSLSEIVTAHSKHRITEPEMRAVYVHSTQTRRTAVKDEHGNALALTQDQALQKIAEFEKQMDQNCETRRRLQLQKGQNQPA